ncbi:DUF2515 family protein [Bacillus suaedae]|uniref:DUF2515 family protein n=1 Tax=Halalkalibacter suaedae TaxID=2822140 RepID=A0A941ANR5_9BACI|nr:DUF2515 family protein [Bacillus suaedae]MBP3950637.1 DUF2515 family protein [Bacillus suaedae]
MTEQTIINNIKQKTFKGNLDNISRTVFYEHFYKKNPEIKWSLLAGIVSRNAGWNMTDLESKWFQLLLEKKYRDLLFHTFERANWTIFEDAYPQLLWYELAKKTGEPNFRILNRLGVSRFMQHEWWRFFKWRDEERLCHALIINEQFMLENTVMKHPIYNKKVFSSLTYVLEEHAHMSYVIFPTLKGDLFGLYVRNFKDVSARIWLGKQLQQLLFHPDVYEQIYQFTLRTEPTGSRRDYERYIAWSTGNSSPFLRTTYPIISHNWKDKKDWSLDMKTSSYFRAIKKSEPTERTKWLQFKWIELYLLTKLKKVSQQVSLDQ